MCADAGAFAPPRKAPSSSSAARCQPRRDYLVDPWRCVPIWFRCAGRGLLGVLKQELRLARSHRSAVHEPGVRAPAIEPISQALVVIWASRPGPGGAAQRAVAVTQTDPLGAPEWQAPSGRRAGRRAVGEVCYRV